MPFLLFPAGVLVVALVGLALFRVGRLATTRAAVVHELRRTLRDGSIDRTADGATVVRGRVGALEVTVDLQRDPARPRQSPLWRVTAEGPIAFEPPTEARVGGWEGWIDPWLQLGETLVVRDGSGLAITLHSEQLPTMDHPLIGALRRQRDRLGPGAIHARRDLVRVETRCGARLEENRPLFAYLHVIGELVELPHGLPSQPAGLRIPSHGVLPESP